MRAAVYLRINADQEGRELDIEPQGPDGGEPTSALVPIVGAVNTFRRLANDLAPELKGLVADAAPVIEPMAEGVAGFVRNAMPGLRELVRDSAPVATELSRSLPRLGQAVGAFLGSLSPGAAGAAVFVTDVIRLASTQAAFWGGVIRRLSQKYLGVRELVSDTGQAFAALPQRARRLVLDLFDRSTAAVGAGVGSALRSRGVGSLPSLVGSTLDAANSTTSTLVDAATEVLARLPARLGRTAAESAAESAADFALATMERATGNLLTGVKQGLAGTTTDAVRPWIPTDRDMTNHSGGVTVNGLNINLYGVWDPTDSAAIDRVVNGIHEALNRYRQEYA
ncbi:hypothetical protein HC028_02445 [Planosporangium flavigriseum]|uniref:Uncharacterized protein n=1 Tax=Planosporangium flavigriseum TaxID=373681 RepID=A0A8J3LXV3_9ACTN|nr:hypothetical protein [Planosporangium flavigriseum]NJC63374.1 hypothetical protein [Planosporangium flavigriseum]GIG75355.1 hypothetical protein Pfl04_37590 [Planosporangium flavigriseum]